MRLIDGTGKISVNKNLQIYSIWILKTVELPLCVMSLLSSILMSFPTLRHISNSKI
jgi:hypothetical protein